MNQSRIELPPPTPENEQSDQHRLVRRLILKWFAEEGGTDKEICEKMPENPTGALLAWKVWCEWEDRDHSKQPDPGLRVAMDLAAYAEWCAKTEEFGDIGDFKGVPHLVISFI